MGHGWGAPAELWSRVVFTLQHSRRWRQAMAWSGLVAVAITACPGDALAFLMGYPGGEGDDYLDR